MIALIMAGGIGSRFWPLSREDNPKQFLPIVSADSMIKLTVNRLLKNVALKDIYIVTAASQVELVKFHIPDLDPQNIIVEPFGMNTAPCIALSLAWLENKYSENETMLVAAADHLITDTDEFYKCVDIARQTAENDMLVTFGIKPDYAAISYGYIEIGDKIGEKSFSVASFKEKPDKKTAQTYLETGRFLWNSGMFLWKLKTIRQAFIHLQPAIWQLLEKIKTDWIKYGKNSDITSLYKQMPRLPVDIGIMEKSANIAVIPSDFGWSDVGGWKALHDISPKDENNNFFKKPGITFDSEDNYIFSEKLVSLIGVKNLVVIETEDVLLIADLDKSEEVKKIVGYLRDKNQNNYL
ncbi:MAG: mannose-1-phosphate guanylyltransferase [Candidatus Cloacimonetes bacterium]|nr:mannose-1-phosphate guanylyltransferase [Candidatus Cloacimonadota bacterium]